MIYETICNSSNLAKFACENSWSFFLTKDLNIIFVQIKKSNEVWTEWLILAQKDWTIVTARGLLVRNLKFNEVVISPFKWSSEKAACSKASG